jgi:hypothetical protein
MTGMPDDIAKATTAATAGNPVDDLITGLVDQAAEVAWKTLERRAGHEPTLVEELEHEHEHESKGTLGHGPSAFDRVVGEEAIAGLSPASEVTRTVRTAEGLRLDPIP